MSSNELSFLRLAKVGSNDGGEDRLFNESGLLLPASANAVDARLANYDSDSDSNDVQLAIATDVKEEVVDD